MSEIPDIINYSSYDVFIVQLAETAVKDNNFECENGKYTEYYRVHAYNDMEMGLGRTSVLIWKSKVIGFISIAMAHMRPERVLDMGEKGYGNFPALLVGHLATHKDFENKGVASHLLSWAIKKAVVYSKTIGCRFVMLNPEDDEKVRQFYRNRKFKYIPHDNKEKDAFIFDINDVIKTKS